MKKNFLIASILAVASFFVYLFTMPASVYTGDSGEIATAVWSWGVAHPTGFPTYIILAKLFSYLLPCFEFAYRLNIFSALTGAATIGIVFFIFQKLKINYWASVAAALSLAFGFSFWNHATLIETYGITAFFFSLEILFLLLFFETGKYRYGYFMAVAGGLGAGAHLTFFLFAPFALIYAVLKILRKEFKFSLKKIIPPFLIFLALASAIYSYIPLRAAANPALNWGDPSTKENFINYITQADYADKIGSRSFESWILMLKELGKIFSREFTWPGLFLICAGAVIIFKKQRIFFYAGLSVIILNIILMGNYGNNQDIMILWRYFLPSCVIMAVFLGYALSFIPAKAGILSLLLPIIIFAAHFGALNRHNNFLAQNITRDIFNSIPEGAILITSGDTLVFSTLYEQAVLGKRKDIILINDSLFTNPWYQEQKKKELEAKGKKYADNIPYLIRDNSDTEFFAVINSNPFLKMNYDFYSRGMVYKIIGKKDSIKLKNFMESNEIFWRDYDFEFLKNKQFKDEYFANEIVKIYSGNLINLAAYLTNNGDVQGGIKYFEKSLEIRENKNALYNLAGIYNALGDKTKALEYKARFDALK